MGLFDKRKQQRNMTKSVNEYFSLIQGYSPVFRSYQGGIYETELTRSAVDSFATHVSKVEMKAVGNSKVQQILDKPNSLMTTSQFLYRLATVFMVSNTAFIVPLFDSKENLIGLYPLATEKCEIKVANGISYLVYEIYSGHKESIELSKVGRLVRMQNKDEIFGESNNVLYPTMELINTTNQAIIEGAKSNASIRFMGKLASIMDSEDIRAEQSRVKEDSLGADNNGGVLLFDSRYAEVKQISSQPYTVSKEQEDLIKNNVYTYFHTNEKILTNSFNEEEWNAYYEGCIEPFLVQLGQVLDSMLFSSKELIIGQKVTLASNRLQYANTATKINYVTSFLDRGVLSMGQAKNILGIAVDDLEDYKTYVIRREYTNVDNLDADINNNTNDNTN